MRSSTTLTLLCGILLASFFMTCADAQFVTIGPSSDPLPVTQESVATISALAAEMYDRWQTLDAACDPRAVFAVAYLYMTASASNLVSGLYFDDGNKMVQFVMTFAGRYISNFDLWDSGNRANVSAPWAQYYSFLETNSSDTTQDLTIGMNVHINYDLAIAAYESGYAVPQWTNDYYRINDLMAMIDNNVTHALGRYDAQFYNTDFLSTTYFQLSIDFVTSWRTNAYLSAVEYQLALTPVLVDTLELATEAEVLATSTLVAIPYPYSTAPSRITYCEANHYPLVV